MCSSFIFSPWAMTFHENEMAGFFDSVADTWSEWVGLAWEKDEVTDQLKYDDRCVARS